MPLNNKKEENQNSEKKAKLFEEYRRLEDEINTLWSKIIIPIKKMGLDRLIDIT